LEADPRLRGDRQSNGGSRHGPVVGGLMSPRSSATSAATVRPGVVSVVLVNYRGATETITCLRAFDDYDVVKDVLFGTGAAMFVRADVFRAVGGFDERFFMFYEDVDLGWRLNLLGHRVRYVPGSVAYHRHHVTMKKFGSFRETYLLERNALLAMYKNYDDETLARVLPAAMALAVRRSLARTGTDATSLDLQRSPGGDDVGTLEIAKMALTGPYAIDYFVEQLPSLIETRRDLQARRRRTDRDLFPLFREAIEPALGMPSYVAAHEVLLRAFEIEPPFRARQRILVVTGEPLGERMAGPGN